MLSMICDVQEGGNLKGLHDDFNVNVACVSLSKSVCHLRMYLQYAQIIQHFKCVCVSAFMHVCNQLG